MAVSIFSWLLVQSTGSHTLGYGYLSVARGDAHVEREQQTSPSLFGRVFPRQQRIWIIKVQSGWENVNETKDRRTPAFIWWRRNEEQAKLSQDHVCADTWGTDEVEAIVLSWMQIWKMGREGRKGDPLIWSSVCCEGNGRTRLCWVTVKQLLSAAKEAEFCTVPGWPGVRKKHFWQS